MAAYPSLTIAFPVGESPPDFQTIETGFEFGYVQRRSKTTTAPRRWSFNHDTLPPADVATWLAFWNSQYGGGNSFVFTDPRTGATCNAVFQASMKPDGLISRTGPQTYRIGPVLIEEVL